VRACAHTRSVAELIGSLPSADQRRWLEEAATCWDEVLGHRAPRTDKRGAEGEVGQLEISVECAPSTPAHDCPSPLVVTSSGEVYSPWTPGLGKTNQHMVTLLRLQTRPYFVLISGGAPGASGRVKISGRKESTSFSFTGGAMHTLARVTVNYY
jgi:hypothetical protein